MTLSVSFRSILTYPWIELGGKCGVRCPQSGYHADIEFHCKVRLQLDCQCVLKCLVPLYSQCMEEERTE